MKARLAGPRVKLLCFVFHFSWRRELAWSLCSLVPVPIL